MEINPNITPEEAEKACKRLKDEATLHSLFEEKPGDISLVGDIKIVLEQRLQDAQKIKELDELLNIKWRGYSDCINSLLFAKSQITTLQSQLKTAVEAIKAYTNDRNCFCILTAIEPGQILTCDICRLKEALATITQLEGGKG